MKTGDLAPKHGISEATLYNWKAKFRGMDVSDAKRLRALEDENGKLKRLLACSVTGADRKSIRYRSKRPAEAELRERLRSLANECRRFGYARLFIMLRREGEPSGINRIYRLYRKEDLGVRKRKGRKRAVGIRTASTSRVTGG